MSHGFWEIRRCVSQTLRRRLQMKRRGVMDQSLHTVFIQISLKLIAFLSLHHVGLENATLTRTLIRYLHIGAQQIIVTERQVTASFGPCVEMPQLHTQHGCLYLVQPAIKTPEIALLAVNKPMIAGLCQPRKDIGVLAGDHAPIAKGMQILERMQTETSGMAPASDALAVQRCADSLRRILQYKKVVTPRDFQNVFHLRGSAG